MKRIVSITILALLVAGAAGSVYATSSWEGDAYGLCNTYPVLDDWVGCLKTGAVDGFEGYWGGKPANTMTAPIYEWGAVWVAHDGDWDSDGEPYNLYGTWEGAFNETSGEMTGDWEATNVDCEGGLDGETAGSHCD